MKRLAMIAVTGIMVLALGACGGDDAPPMPDAGGDDMMQPKAQEAAPAAPDAAAAPEAPAATGAPTDEQMAGAAAQE
ncbi:MAG: hypothetical protein K0U37_00545 [Gammaproteobacteria bacterium]|nr:hypothetical protein [Gammaproteobacteria bacterium]